MPAAKKTEAINSKAKTAKKAVKNAAKKTAAKGSSRKKKLVGPESNYVLPSPINVDIRLEKGERLTRLTFAHPVPSPVIHSADTFFAQAFDQPEVLIDPAWWLVTKPWLQNTPVEIEEFWTSFNTAEAIQERMWCTSGDKFVSWQNERLLISTVHMTRRILTDEIKVPSSIDIFPMEVTLMMRLAEWVMKAVETDPAALRRLLTLLKNPKAANDTTNRERINRGVFESFARLVSVEQKLPSKKQVREGAYIADDDHGRSMASRAYDELGLSGLQKG